MAGKLLIFCFIIFLYPFKTLYSQPGLTDSAIVKQALNDSLLSASYDADTLGVIYALSRGADVNTHDLYGQTSLMFVVQSGNLELTKLLVAYGAKINVTPDLYGNEPPLICAAKYGYSAIAKYLLENGAQVMIKDKYGATALHYAALYNDTGLFAILIPYHPDLNTRTNDGETSLLWAAFNGSASMVNALLGEGADVNIADSRGFTPLMVAAQNGQYESVESLLEGWAEVNIKNKRGFSALSLAIANGYVRIVDLLLLNGADKNEQNGTGLNPLELAKIFHRKAIMDTLRKWNSKPDYKPYFRCFQPELRFLFNSKDLLTGVGFTVRDPNYNLEAGVHYYFRPKAIPVLIYRQNNLYYQYWERRNILGIFLAKLIPLMERSRNQLGIMGGMKYDYNFGTYRGTKIAIQSGFFASPFVGAYFAHHNLFLKCSVSYSKYNITGLSNWYTDFSISYQMPNTLSKLNKSLKLK